MRYDGIIIRYGETYLKSAWARKKYISLLKKSIRAKTGVSVGDERGILVAPWFEGFMKLSEIPGIQSFSPFVKAGRREDEIISAVVRYGKQVIGNRRFRITAKRQDKSLPFTSRDIQIKAGKALESEGFAADLERPEVEIEVRIGRETRIFHEKFSGMGGFPLGSNGRAIALVSGGIDSPVAAYLMIKKGVVVHPLFLRLGSADFEKYQDICIVLRKYHAGQEMRCLYLDAPPIRRSRFTLMALRRLLVQVASEFAKANGYDFIITGESLGQVASQTPENMKYLDSFSDVPVIRPLVSFDKEEIVRIARKIGTYGISIRTKGKCEELAHSLGTSLKPSPEIDDLLSGIDIQKMVKKVKEI